MANYVRYESLGEDYDTSRRDEMPITRKRKIEKHRKHADLYGPPLPYDIGIFKKKFGSKPKDAYVECLSCGKAIGIRSITRVVICACGEVISIDE